MAKETTTKKRATKTTKKPARKTTAARATKKPAVKKVAASKKSAKKKTLASAVRSKRLSMPFKSRRAENTRSDVDSVSLNRLNKWLAFLYLIEGGLILLLSKTVLVSITATYLAKDALQSQANGSSVLAPASQGLFDVNPAYLLAGTLFVLAIAHAAAALWYRGRYETGLQSSASGLRWVAGALGLGGALTVVALVCGVRDIVTLALFILLIVGSSVLGYILDLLSGDRQRLNALVYRLYALAFFVVWAVLGAYLLFSGIYDGNVPTYVYYLFASTVILSFVLTSYVRMQQVASGKWANYNYVERMVYLVSFVLVSAIAWQVYAGLLS
jgi:hypothetical protein